MPAICASCCWSAGCRSRGSAAHILDLRARVRCRHTLVHQKTEWQRRIQAVLYHHGIPQKRNLLTLEKREWLAGLKLPAAARQQVTIALEMIDAFDLQLGPFDIELRAYASKRGGCCALADQIYDVGALTSVTILAELGDARRFPSSRDVVRYGGLEPGRLSRRLRIEDDLSSGQETLRGCHDPGSTQMS